MGLTLSSVTGPGIRDAIAQTPVLEGEPQVLPTPGAQGPGPDGPATSSGFRLFGSDDLALAGLRFQGNWSACVENSGNLVSSRQCWFNSTPPLFVPDWFDIFFYVAAPPSEWRKHRAAVPSLANARGKGHTVNTPLTQYLGEMLPHDGTRGPFHAGVPSTSDESCLDVTRDHVSAGRPLLAMSDCEPTWGSRGWQGSPRIDREGWSAYADMVGASRFAFDAHRVPETFHASRFLSNNVHTFGFFSDYSVEALFGSAGVASYGNVIPQEMGGDPGEEPTRTGWPLGMLVKMDAFSSDRLDLANVGFFRLTVTNNSREVYGVGLDYDSLYMGLLPGWLTYNGPSLYRDPANGVVRGATLCQTPSCGPGGDPMHPADQWGAIPPAGVGAGFNYGAAAIVVLKSPIGDLRNKKFTNPDSPFFGMGDPQSWDDTITFNHGHMCGFHGCSAVTFNADAPDPPIPADTDHEQRQLGMVASITSDVAGDRNPLDPGSIAEHTAWDTWRWEEFPDRTQIDFNKWSPGGWDHDDDGVPDTLYYDDCSGNAGSQFDPFTGLAKRCAVSWSDTLSSGLGNVYANRGAVTGVGPFRLPADSSAEWVFALVMATDQFGTGVGVEDQIAAAIAQYQRFFLVAEPPPPPGIASVQVRAGGPPTHLDGGPRASVTLFLDDAAEDFRDPVIEGFLDDLLAAPDDDELGRIRLLNPSLADTLADLVQDNVERVYLFKSCDGGETFTDDRDCVGNRPGGATGPLAEIGWLPYATFEPDTDGSFPDVFQDDSVTGGRSYQYALAAVSRGAEFVVRTAETLDTTGTGEIVCGSGCGLDTIPLAPALHSSLRTDPSLPPVASVYVPVSQQSGSRPSTVELAEGSPDHIPFGRMNVRTTTDEVADGRYTLRFGDTVQARLYSSKLQSLAFQPESAQVVVSDRDAAPDTFFGGSAAAVDGPFTESIDTAVVGGGADTLMLQVRTSTFDRLTAVLTDSAGAPLLVSADLTGDAVVSGAYLGLPRFPGFIMSVDNTRAREFEGQAYLEADGDTVGPLVTPSVTLRPEQSGLIDGTRRYRVTWTDRPFGPNAPFRLDPNDPEGVRAAVIESLQRREAGQTASTDPAVASFVGFPVEQLVPARLPFVIENVTGPSPQPVHVAVARPDKRTSLLLGSDLDTLFVTVPENEWIPGDELLLVDGEAPNFRLAFQPAVLGCDPEVWERLGCNPLPVDAPGATGYIGARPGQQLRFGYLQEITGRTEFAFDVTSAETGDRLLDSPTSRGRIRAALDSVKVVPNPFVLFSEYSVGDGAAHIYFTHVPPRGVVRIYTVAGQFIQQIEWEPHHLNGRGDLAFDLTTRENNTMAAGLYLYVLTALDAGGAEIGTKKGKFVVIR